MNKIPHIAKLMVKTMEEVLEHAQTIIIGNNSFEFQDLMDRVRDDQQVIDLVRVVEDRNTNGTYNGICW